MSDKRYYYTDPLAAAWMSDIFGMQFSGDGWSMSMGRSGQFTAFPSKFYIHPDSLHVLEPQVGDLCASQVGSYGLYRVPLKPSGIFFDGRNLTIIQRDDKPFHWPECEEAAERSIVGDSK